MGVNVATLRVETRGYDEAKAKTAELKKEQQGLAQASADAGRQQLTLAQATAQAQSRMEMQTRVLLAEAQANAALAQSLSTLADRQMRAANDQASALGRVGDAFVSATKYAYDHPIIVAAGAATATRALSGLATSAAGSLGAASAATARFANDNAEMGRTVTSAAGLAARSLSLAEAGATAAAGGLAAVSQRITSVTTAGGLMSRGLSALAPILGGLAVGFVALEIASAVLGKANADLERLVGLGKQAETLDIGAAFLKQFQGIGEQLGAEVDQINAALQRASSFAQDRFGQGNSLSKLFGEVEAGGATGLSARVKEQAALAQTVEERIRVALAGMADLEASGQRLAVLKIGETVFGPEIADRLRRGQISVAAIVASLDQVRGGALVNQGDVDRAVALERDIAAVKDEIGKSLGITVDFSKGTLSLKESWLGVLQTVRDLTPNLAGLVKQGDAATQVNIQRLQAQLAAIETVSLPDAISRGQADRVQTLTTFMAGLRGEIDRLSGTLDGATAKIDADVGRIQPPLALVSDELLAMFQAAERAAGGLYTTAAGAQAAALSLDNAAIKARGFSDALNAIQAANPSLAGTLSLLGKIDEINRTAVEGVAGIQKQVNAGKLGDTEAQQQIIRLNTEAAASIKTLRTEAEKPITGYIREAELGGLKDLPKTLAQASDRYAEVRQRAENYYKVQIEKAATPEARGALEAERTRQLGKLDAAYQQVQRTARDDAAEKGAKAAAKSAKEAAQEFETFKDKAVQAYAALDPAGALRKQGLELQAELEKYRDQLMKIDPDYVLAIETKIKLNLDGKDIENVKDKSLDLSKEMSHAFRGVFDDMFQAGNKGLDGFLDNIAKSGAKIGSRLLEQNLIAPLLGGQSSLSGGAGLDLGKLFDTGGIRDAVGQGAFAGVTDAFEPLLKQRTNAAGKQMGFASSPLGGSLMAAGVGASIGYSSQSPLMGALGGGLSGAMLGAQMGTVAGLPGMAVGALIGAGAGLLGGLFGASEAKEQKKKAIAEQLRQWKEAYDDARPAIEQLRRTLRGEGTGSVTGQIEGAFQQMRQAAVTAEKGGDSATAIKLQREFEQFAIRMRTQFMRAFEGTLSEMNAGQGLSGPFAQAAAAVTQLGEALKGFVEDATHLPDAEKNAANARRAAQESALASLETPRALSATQAELSRIRGTAAGLTQVLVDLGMSADQAATAIAERTAKAIDALRASFSDDLDRKLNEASGKGYLNEVADLLKERQGLLADAAALGTDSTKVEAYFTASVQKIVDGSELTGDAFTALTAAFPDLTGRVHEFATAVDTAAAKAAAAARALGYQDRLFAATNDTSTLEGQLAAYDRKAAQERLDEARAGGQALADLEAAQTAERLKILKDYYSQDADARAQALEQARTAYATWARSVRDYVTGLRTGASSPLSPGDRLAAAQSAYDDTLRKAQGGDRTALDAVTGRSTDLLDAAKAMFASGQGFQAIFAKVTDQLTALPEQVAPEQFLAETITKAATDITGATALMRDTLLGALRSDNPAGIAVALQGFFGTLDTSLDGLLSAGEFLAGLGPIATQDQQAAALAVFRSIDANGDGLVSAIELMRQQVLAGLAGNDPSVVARALLPQFGALTAATGGLLSLPQLLAAVAPLATAGEQQAARAIFAAIDANGDGQVSRLELLNAQSAGLVAANDNAVALAGQQKALLDTIAALTGQQQTLLTAIGTATAGTRSGVDTSASLLAAINSLSGLQRDQLVALTGQFGVNTNLVLYGRTLNDNMVTALNKIVFNTAGIVVATKSYGHLGEFTFAEGGWITGPGSATSDSVRARLSNGEFVVNAASARVAAPWLEAINDNPGMVPAMPVPVPMAAAGGFDIAPLIAEIRALRTENKAQAEMIGRLTKQAGDQIAAGVGEVREEVAGSRDDEHRRARRSGTGIVGRAERVAA